MKENSDKMKWEKIQWVFEWVCVSVPVFGMGGLREDSWRRKM